MNARKAFERTEQTIHFRATQLALRHAFFALACCALFSPVARSQDAPAPAANPQTQLDNQTVAEIRITDAAGNVLPDKLPLMPLQTGKPFDLEAERSSLRALYATGRYDRIETRAINTSAGLRIDFVVQRTLYNNVVRVEGLREPPTEASALSAIRMPLGEPFRPSALADGIARLSSTLQDEGLYQAHLQDRKSVV